MNDIGLVTARRLQSEFQGLGAENFVNLLKEIADFGGIDLRGLLSTAVTAE